MIHLINAPCEVRQVSLAQAEAGPKLEVKLAIPDVDAASLIGIWPDIEAMCSTCEAFELASKVEGIEVELELFDVDRKSIIHIVAHTVGKLRYDRAMGAGKLSIALVADCPDADLRPILGSTFCSLEQVPDPQVEMFA